MVWSRAPSRAAVRPGNTGRGAARRTRASSSGRDQLPARRAAGADHLGRRGREERRGHCPAGGCSSPHGRALADAVPAPWAPGVAEPATAGASTEVRTGHTFVVDCPGLRARGGARREDDPHDRGLDARSHGPRHRRAHQLEQLPAHLDRCGSAPAPDPRLGAQPRSSVLGEGDRDYRLVLASPGGGRRPLDR